MVRLRRRHRIAALPALCLAVAVVTAACTADADDDRDVTVSGSSTVEPISIRVAELYEDRNPDVFVDVDGPGTGDGFQLFCEGEIDIAGASRAIKPEEIETCERNGVELIELKVAIDGLSVLTNPANDAVDCLTFADLYALVGPESEDVERWNEAEPLASELGSTTELPDAPLAVTAPGEESGTYDSFIEIALADIAEERVEAGAITEEEAETTRRDYQSSGDDTTIIQGIEGTETSFGWVGFAFAQEAGDDVKAIEIDGGEGCVAPTEETIADGTYPISRPLFIYVSAAAAERKPAVRQYVDFYLGAGNAAVAEMGYVPLPEEELQATVDVWRSRQTGTRES